MAEIHIIVSASLRGLKGCADGRLDLPCDGELVPQTVQDILARLQAIPGEVGLIVLNGVKAEAQTPIRPGDTLELYPLIAGG